MSDGFASLVAMGEVARLRVGGGALSNQAPLHG